MKKKTVNKLLSILLTLVMVLGLATNASSTKAAIDNNLNSYITSAVINHGDTDSIEASKSYSLEVKTTDITITDLTGGTYEITLPDGIDVTDISSTDIYATINDESTKVGSYTVSSNTINITLDDLLENGTTTVADTTSYTISLDVTMEATFDGETTEFVFNDDVTLSITYYEETTLLGNAGISTASEDGDDNSGTTLTATSVDASSYFSSTTSAIKVDSTSTFIDQDNAYSKITTSSGDTTTIIENGESYTVTLHLEFVDGTISTGTLYYIDLSDISQYLDIDTSDIPTSASDAQSITDTSGNTIGYWYLDTTTNRIYFVFTENVVDEDDVWAEITLNATGSDDGSDSDSEDVKVDLGTDTWEGTYVKSESSLTVNKTTDSTTVTEDNGNEKGTYTYSVKITSTGTNELTTLQDYFKYSWTSDSYKLLSYTGDGSDITVTVYNSDGTVSTTLTYGTDYTVSYSNDSDGYITITFTDGYTLTDGQYIIVTYTLTYDPTSVTVTMDEVTNYNKVTVSYENNKEEDKSTSDDETNKTSINHGTVEKDGSVSEDNNSVTWTVTATMGNSSTEYLNSYVLQDDGTTGMDIDYTKTYSVTIYFTDGTNYTLSDSDAQTFISAMVSTSGVTISDYLTGDYASKYVKEVVVVYTTTDDGTTYQNQTYTASNTVELDKDGTEIDEATKGIDGVGTHVDQGTIEKELLSINQLTNTVSWKTTITVYPTGALDYYVDELSTWNTGGHALSTNTSDYTVTYTYYDDSEGKNVSLELTEGTDYTITINSDTKYTIDFDPDIVNSTTSNITIVIEYTTTYTEYLSSGTQISNKGTAYFENEYESDSDSTVVYRIIDKSVSSVDEESGTITWTISVDLFEILDKYYIYDSDTDTYTLSLPSSIVIKDTLPTGTELASNVVTLYNAFWQFSNWDSSDKQITATSDSGTVTIDLTSTLTKLFTSGTSDYLEGYISDSASGNTYARFLTLTYSTIVTDYYAYLTGGEQEFTNSAELYGGDDLLSEDEETTKMTGESYLGKSGTDQSNGYYLFTVDGIAELVTAYTNSSTYDKDATNWTTVTLTDVYGADLQYDSSFNPTYSINSVSYTIYLEGNEPDSSGTYVTYSIDESTHTITFNIPYSIAIQLDSISYYLKVLATTSDDLSQLSLTNTIYLEGNTETAAEKTVEGITSGSGVVGGYTTVLFHITKTDSDTGDALSGAEFTIYEADYDETNGFSYDKDSVIDSGTTLSDGKLTLSNLTVNTLYAVVETETPNGYVDILTVYYAIFVKSEDTVNSTYGDSLLQVVSDTFIIKTISSSDSGTTISITQGVTNTKEDAGELTITKSITNNNEIDLTDDDTLELLKGSTITTTNQDDLTEYTIDLYELYVTYGGSKTYTLPLGTYTVTESGTVYGYTYTTTYDVTVSGTTTSTTDPTVIFSSDGDEATVTITNTFTKETKTSIDVEKVWNDGGINHTSDSITVYLVVDGVIDYDQKLVLNDSTNWSGSFDNLDVYDSSNNIITYSVAEETQSGYSTEYSGSMADGYVITNTLKTSLTVTKSWNDSAVSSSRPSSITVQLYQNDAAYGSTVTLSADDWTYTYTDLPMYNAKGIAYTYTIEEVGESSGLITYGDNTYTVKYDQSNYIITNTITGTTEVSGTKTWKDGGLTHDNESEITLILQRTIDGTNYETVDSADYTVVWSDSTYTISGLAKYDDDGNEYTYKVTEKAISGYNTTYEGYNITNTITETTEVSGTKTWKDGGLTHDNESEITLILQRTIDGTNYETVDSADYTVVWSDNTYTISGLAKYDDDGNEYTYKVTEKAISGYNTTYEGYNITNTITETTSVSVTKVWSDSEDQDGIRPDSVTVTLLADGQSTGKTVTLSEDNGWTASFDNLDKYSIGKEIDYTVEEEDVSGYTVSITGDATEGYTITNSHTTETTSVSVTKVWSDNEDQDGIRPESVTITLLADGQSTGKTVTLSEDNGWTASFDNLDKYSNGKEISYTVEEEDVSGYTVSITGDATEGYTITDCHTPEIKDIVITKTWSDYNNADNSRPDAITIHLYANYVEIGTYEITSEDNWTLRISDLSVYEDGEEIVYTITEDDVTGYTSDINGFVITNTYTTSMSVSGVKTWDDSDNLYNTRPESITINLMNGDEVVASKEVSADTNGEWTYSFTDLEKYNEDGSEIVYSIEEVAVNGYTSEVTGYDITNTLITGNLVIKKISNGTETPDDTLFTIYDANGNTIKEILYSEFTNGTYTLEGLAIGTYTVVESNADVDGYTLEVDVASIEVAIEEDTESSITFTNTYTEITEEETETGVKTGDDSHVLGYSLLAMISLAFIAIFRKRRYE